MNKAAGSLISILYLLLKWVLLYFYALLLMVVVILVFLETIHLSWYDFKFLFINIYLTVSVKRVTREIRIRLRFSDVSSTTTYRIVTVLSIVCKCATSRANCLTSYGRILILRFLSDHLLIPEHLLHVMGCDTLTPKDIRLSNIQQTTNTLILRPLSVKSQLCMLMSCTCLWAKEFPHTFTIYVTHLT